MKWDWTTALVLQSELQFSGLQFFNFFRELLIGQPVGFIERHQDQVSHWGGLLRLHHDGPTALAFSPNGAALLAVDCNPVQPETPADQLVKRAWPVSFFLDQ